MHPLFSGAGDEARTRYLHLGKVALYRMSYTRGTRCIITDFLNKSIPFWEISVFPLAIFYKESFVYRENPSPNT